MCDQRLDKSDRLDVCEIKILLSGIFTNIMIKTPKSFLASVCSLHRKKEMEKKAASTMASRKRLLRGLLYHCLDENMEMDEKLCKHS